MSLWDPERIASLCLSGYDSLLPLRGKPCLRSNGISEWTILSGVVMTRPHDLQSNLLTYQLISLCTGVKVLGSKSYPKSQGTCLLDLHSEILSRRVTRDYLLDQVELCCSDQSLNQFQSIFTCPPLIRLKDGIQFHMYLSQSPCGDASLSALNALQTLDQEVINLQKRATWMINNETSPSPSPSPSSVRKGRLNYTELGVLRTKPGRLDADPSLSLSCSDKLSSWTVLGFQGSLLSSLLPPIYFTSLVLSPNLWDEDGLERINHRASHSISDSQTSSTPHYSHHPITFYKCQLEFPHGKINIHGSEVKSWVTCNKSIIWKTPNTVEILASNGYIHSSSFR